MPLFATKKLPPPEDPIVADQRRREHARQGRLGPFVQTVRDYVPRLVAGEILKADELALVDEAIERLGMTQANLLEWANLQKLLDQNAAVLGLDRDGESRRLIGLAEEKFRRIKAAEAELAMLRSEWRTAIHAERTFSTTRNQLEGFKRACPVMYGSISQALAALFPPPPDSPAHNYPNAPPPNRQRQSEWKEPPPSKNSSPNNSPNKYGN